MTDSPAGVLAPSSVSTGLPKPVGVIGWILFALLVMAYADPALMLLDGHHPDATEWLGTTLWTAIVVAYFWKRRGRRGWQGFLVGSAIGLAAYPAMILVCALGRGLIHKF